MQRIQTLFSEDHLVIEISSRTQLDLDILNTLAWGESSCFCSCTYQECKKKHRFIYDIRGLQPLERFMEEQQGNRDAIFALVKDFLQAIAECGHTGISPENLVLQKNCIYTSAGNFQWIVLPVENSRDEDFQKAFQRLIKRIRPWLLQCEGLYQILKSPRTQDSLSALVAAGDTHMERGENPKAHYASQTETTVFSEEAETTLFSASMEKETNGNVSAILLRNKTGERIPVSQAVFIIGNRGGSVDYELDDNSSVSRRHASLLFEDGRFYLMDLGSTNGTFIEGVAIYPDEKIRMDNGTLFALGNEIFQIFIEENTLQ